MWYLGKFDFRFTSIQRKIFFFFFFMGLNVDSVQAYISTGTLPFIRWGWNQLPTLTSLGLGLNGQPNFSFPADGVTVSSILLYEAFYDRHELNVLVVFFYPFSTHMRYSFRIILSLWYMNPVLMKSFSLNYYFNHNYTCIFFNRCLFFTSGFYN